jgi:hypothetical protein
MQTLPMIAATRWDYVSPNFVRVFPDEGFPHMIIGDVERCRWPWLRRDVPHNWYADRRNGHVGFVSRDEAAILYNTAIDFSGRRGLEIGCWMGWSSAHLLLGNIELDIIDPLFTNPAHLESISSSLRWVIDHGAPRSKAVLHAGVSPDTIPELWATQTALTGLDFLYQGI